MSKFTISQIDNKIINKYLFYKNLDINRIYSSDKRIIKKIDHYLWWFKKQKLKENRFIILKKKKPLFISTSDHIKSKNYKFIYSGLT